MNKTGHNKSAYIFVIVSALVLLFCFQNCSGFKSKKTEAELVYEEGFFRGLSVERSDKDPSETSATFELGAGGELISLTVLLEDRNLNPNSQLTIFEGEWNGIVADVRNAEVTAFKIKQESFTAQFNCATVCLVRLVPKNQIKIIEQQNPMINIDLAFSNPTRYLNVTGGAEQRSSIQLTGKDNNGQFVPDCSNQPILADRATWEQWHLACPSPKQQGP